MQITATTKDAYELMHRGCLALQKASQNGMRIDTEYCKQKITELNGIVEKHYTRFWKTKTGLLWNKIYKDKRNLNSDPQLRNILFKKLKLKSTKLTSKENQSVDYEVLSILAKEVPEIRHILKIRKYDKAKNTYLKGLLREQVDGILHPFFPTHLVVTFRSSSRSINFHNQPKRDKEFKKIVRSAIYPRPGHQLGAADFSGVEVSIAGCYTEDDRLIYDIIHGDMHRDMAQELYMVDEIDKHHSGENNLRQGGKNSFVFPEFYGDYWRNCAAGLLKWAEISSLRDGTPALIHLQNKRLIKLDKNGVIKNSDKFEDHVRKIEDDFWNVRYKKYQAWKNTQWKKYTRQGYIDSLTGFRYSGVMGPKELNNYPIQGSAFHCLLWAFIETTERIKDWDTFLIGQIHDEAVADIAPTECSAFFKLIQQIACAELLKAWKWIIVPLKIEAEVAPVDSPWNELTDYEL